MGRKEDLSSSTIRMLRWIVLFPVGLGILFLSEYLINLAVDWSLDWALEGPAFYAVFFLGGLVVFLSIVLSGFLTRITGELIAPAPQKGLRLLGASYLLIQTIGFCSLFVSGTTWHGVTIKIGFTLVTAALLLPKRHHQGT